MQSGDLVHQLVVHSKAAGGIDDDDRVAFLPGFLDGVPGDLDRVLDAVFAVDGHAHGLAEHLELLDGGGTEGVAGGEHDLHAFLALDVEGQLAGEGRLTGTVQAGDEHHGGIALEVHLRGGAAHEGGHLVADDLDHHLLRLDGREHVLSEGLVLDGVAEFLRDLEAHVGVQQGLADVLDGLRDVDFGDLAFAFEDLERPLQSFA